MKNPRRSKNRTDKENERGRQKKEVGKTRQLGSVMNIPGKKEEKKLGPAVIWRQKKTFFKRRKHQRRLNSREPLIMLQQSNIRHFRLNFWHSGSGLCGAMKMAKSWKEGMATKRRRSGSEGCKLKTRCQQGLFTAESLLISTLLVPISVHNIN